MVYLLKTLSTKKIYTIQRVGCPRKVRTPKVMAWAGKGMRDKITFEVGFRGAFFFWLLLLLAEQKKSNKTNTQ